MNKIVPALLFAALTSITSAHGQTAFEGFHGGGYAGYTPIANDNRSIQAGALTGFRFSASENFILGIEVQGGAGSLNGRVPMLEAVVLTQAGVAIDNTLLFASAGIGHRRYEDVAFFPSLKPDTFYALGGGVELAANESIHLRLEAQRLISTDNTGYIGASEAFRTNFGVIAQFN